MARHPNNHPEFQGCVPDKWMDRCSGYISGSKRVETHMRGGMDSVCQMGLAGFMRDTTGARMYNESQGRCRRAVPDVAMWGEREITWRPGKKISQHPCKSEPDLLSQRPPQIQRKGSHVLYYHARPLPPTSDEYEFESFRQKHQQKVANRRRLAAKREDRREKAMVCGLEAWERAHLSNNAPAAAQSGVAQSASTGARISNNSGSLAARRGAATGRSMSEPQSKRILTRRSDDDDRESQSSLSKTNQDTSCFAMTKEEVRRSEERAMVAALELWQRAHPGVSTPRKVAEWDARKVELEALCQLEAGRNDPEMQKIVRRRQEVRDSSVSAWSQARMSGATAQRQSQAAQEAAEDKQAYQAAAAHEVHLHALLAARQQRAAAQAQGKMMPGAGQGGPPQLVGFHPPSIVCTVGQACPAISPIVYGMVDSYSVSPALPPNMSLDSETGVITGVPMLGAPQALYEITAKNHLGSCTKPLNITVQEKKPRHDLRCLFEGTSKGDILSTLGKTHGPGWRGRVRENLGSTMQLPHQAD